MVTVRLGVLGPLEISTADGLIAVGAAKPKAVLAMVLARANTVVSDDELIEELWGDRPPASTLANLRLYVANLRRLFAQAEGSRAPALHRRGRGYLLAVDPVDVDVYRFRELARQGRAAVRRGDHPGGAARLDEALALWRGRVLADVPAGLVLTRWSAAVEQERLSVQEDCAEAHLDQGNPQRAGGLAREVLLAEPLRERAHGLLIRARYLCGDIAGALAAFDAARRTLADELGVAPGEELERLQVSVLNRAPDLGRSLPAPAAPRVAGAVTPRQLPADVSGFAGRTEQLRQLDALLPAPAGGAGSGRPSTVVAISGAPGVGKTSLAVRWAHRVRDRFPDGQLYVDLRGFDGSGPVMAPVEALRGFLDALHVSASRIPAELSAEVGLYRSLLADRRVLILLDNARDADQVRPLLPGSAECVVVVTSRNQLPGLVATDGAHPLILDLPDREEARRLLAHRLGAARVDAQPDAVDEIITRCARLPLALAIVAARAALHADAPLSLFAAQLRSANSALEPFIGDDPATDVRGVFSWSYRTLDPPAARLFRLLGLHPATTFGPAAAASLASVPAGQARRLLDGLVTVHLVERHSPDRYGFHDLLRAYAVELTNQHDADADRRVAVHRMLDYYLHSAINAARRIAPHRPEMAVAAPVDGMAADTFADHGGALAWSVAELPGILAMVDVATAAGFDRHVPQLAWAIGPVLGRQAHWHSDLTMQQTALDVARHLGDRVWQAQAHADLARPYGKLGRYDDAHKQLSGALDLHRQLGDHTGEARVLLGLSWINNLQARHEQALPHARRALAIYQRTGDRFGQAYALNAAGWNHAKLAQLTDALACCRRALAIHEEVGNAAGQANTLDSLGFVHLQLSEHEQAIDCYQRSLDLYREVGDRYLEADTLTHLGDAQLAAGSPSDARLTWWLALDILDELDHPDAATVRTKLAELRRGDR